MQSSLCAQDFVSPPGDLPNGPLKRGKTSTWRNELPVISPPPPNQPWGQQVRMTEFTVNFKFGVVRCFNIGPQIAINVSVWYDRIC